MDREIRVRDTRVYIPPTFGFVLWVSNMLKIDDVYVHILQRYDPCCDLHIWIFVDNKKIIIRKRRKLFEGL